MAPPRYRRKIFDLEGVPESEAADIRRILLEQKVSFFEVPSGQWLRGGGLWVRSEKNFIKARRCINAYQADLQEKQRKIRAQTPRPWCFATARRLKKNPVLIVVLFLALVVLIQGYVSSK